MNDDDLTPATWALTVAMFTMFIAPTAEVRAEAAAVANMIARTLTPDAVRICADLAEEMAAASSVLPGSGVLIDPVRSTYLHDVGGHDWIAATAIDSDGTESFVLAERREINNPTATYDTEPPPHEAAGMLPENYWWKLWGTTP